MNYPTEKRLLWALSPMIKCIKMIARQLGFKTYQPHRHTKRKPLSL